MNKEDQIKQEIRENWFPKHKVTLTKQGNLTVLDWSNPKSNCYAVRYVFDGNKMYITGDIGEALFCLTWKADVHSFNGISTIYFMEKMRAYSDDKYDFDSDEGKSELEDWKIRLLEDREFKDEFDKEEFMDSINNLIGAVDNCSNEEQWAYEYVNGTYNDFISEEDCDYWEWIYHIGRVIPHRIYGYIVGLQMASEQLKDEENISMTCKLMKELMDVDEIEKLSYESIEQIRRIICGEHGGACSERYSGIKYDK